MYLYIDETDFEFADCHTCALKHPGILLHFLSPSTYAFEFSFKLILCLSVPEREKGQEGMLPRGGFLLFLFKKNA